MKEPLVSIIIPFYTGKKWLIESVKSVLNQTYKNIEVIVINDGSIENIEDLSVKFKNLIKIIKKDNGGPASARNLGIKESLGKYVAFLDSDDLWLPNKLACQISYMRSENYVWSQHSYEMFWEESKRTKIINTSIYQGNVYLDCFISFKIQTSCVVVLKSVLLDNDIWFPTDKRFGQDVVFFKKIAKIYPLGFVNGILSRFRIRGSNAGFNIITQINDRTSTWNSIKEDKELLTKLPQPIIWAYRTVKIFNKFLLYIIINKKISKGTVEVTAKLLYVFPYLIFKLYSK